MNAPAPTKRRPGRPPKWEGEIKRASFQTRMHESLRARLQEAATKNGHSLSEEIERRLVASYGRIEDQFGGADGLRMAIMLYANFSAAGGARAAVNGHPEWTPAEWLADSDCFEQALETLVRSVWEHHPGPVTRKDLLRWLENLFQRVFSQESTEQWNAERGAEAAAADPADESHDHDEAPQRDENAA